jgi:hypothetical protein
LVPSRGEGTHDDATGDETFLAALARSTEPRSTPAVGEVVTCRRHGPRPVVQVTAGIAYLRCGCQAVEALPEVFGR